MIDWTEQNSSDFFLSTSTNTFAGIPINKDGNCYAQNGSNYCGFLAYAPSEETKEYISQKLTSPLVSGKTYCISFYVSRADYKEYAIQNIGAYFSNNMPSVVPLAYINASPQVVNQNGLLLDTIGWTEIQGCFTANGGEQYLTIGNFNSSANTNALFIGTNNSANPPSDFAYYFIDNITLIDQSTVGVNEINVSTKINLFPNPNNGNMQLDYDLGNYSEAMMKLYDVTGKLVNTYKLQTAKGSLQMNEQNLANGIYFYRILVGEKTIKTDKIVIIKHSVTE